MLLHVKRTPKPVNSLYFPTSGLQWEITHKGPCAMAKTQSSTQEQSSLLEGVSNEYFLRSLHASRSQGQAQQQAL